MKKIIFLIPCIILLLVVAACSLDEMKGGTEQTSGVVNMAITLPQDFEAYGLSGYTVEFRNTNLGFRYLRQTDAEGKVSQEIEYGPYQVVVRGEITTPGGKAIVSGQASIVFNADYKNTIPLVVDASVNMLSPIILSEIFFSNSRFETGANFAKDKYFVVHNNTPEVQYLDGVGIGFHQAANSNGTNYYVKADGVTPRDSVPHQWAFIIPGSGKDHPLQPGEDAIFALNAVDHTALEGAGPLFVNLARENVWATYRSEAPATTGQDPPQPPSKLAFSYFTPGLGNQVIISVTSPAVFIYRFEGLSAILDTYEKVAMDYVKNPPVPGKDGGHVQFQPGGNNPLTSQPVVNIPKEWVLDGVEIHNGNAVFNKRFPTSIETGRLLGPAQYSGMSLIRKVNEVLSAEYGFTVYQDTNNSEEDWITIDQPSLVGKP
ncbi:MAG: DUF4876 domain-containing protein [Prevotellaceae bacterium]|jgi:hypothetical protein|nr:DUF4876 domain-containing protein [Prevotellaceae bacterium]